MVIDAVCLFQLPDWTWGYKQDIFCALLDRNSSERDVAAGC
jgi:hypothetical protein